MPEGAYDQRRGISSAERTAAQNEQKFGQSEDGLRIQKLEAELVSMSLRVAQMEANLAQYKQLFDQKLPDVAATDRGLLSHWKTEFITFYDEGCNEVVVKVVTVP